MEKFQPSPEVWEEAVAQQLHGEAEARLPATPREVLSQLSCSGGYQGVLVDGWGEPQVSCCGTGPEDLGSEEAPVHPRWRTNSTFIVFVSCIFLNLCSKQKLLWVNFFKSYI